MDDGSSEGTASVPGDDGGGSTTAVSGSQTGEGGADGTGGSDDDTGGVAPSGTDTTDSGADMSTGSDSSGSEGSSSESGSTGTSGGMGQGNPACDCPNADHPMCPPTEPTVGASCTATGDDAIAYEFCRYCADGTDLDNAVWYECIPDDQGEFAGWVELFGMGC